MNEIRVHDLIERYLSGGLEGEDRQSLEAALLASPQARALYWQLATTHADMREWGLGQFGLEATSVAARRRTPGWSWNNWPRSSAVTAAALLVAAGSLLFAGIAWAIVPRPRPILEIRLPLADPGFETGNAPATQPAEGCTLGQLLPSYGAWASDVVRITGAEQGVTPYEGSKMLCFEKPLPAPGATDELRALALACDLFQFVDLKPLHDDIATGEATLELSARFCDQAMQRDFPLDFDVRLFVYDSSLKDVGETWPHARLDAVAMNQVRWRSSVAHSDWKRFATKTLLPPGSRFALVHITVGLTHERTSSSHLGRQYCDDVRLVFNAPATDGTTPRPLAALLKDSSP